LQQLAEDLAALPLDEVFGLTMRQLCRNGREQLLDQVFALHTGLVKDVLDDACCASKYSITPLFPSEKTGLSEKADIT
jgi:hypothetical protein